MPSVKEVEELLNQLDPNTQEFWDMVGRQNMRVPQGGRKGRTYIYGIRRHSYSLSVQPLFFRNRVDGAGVEVYLQQRPAEGTYPLEYFAPATGIEVHETTEDAFRRLEQMIGVGIEDRTRVSEYWSVREPSSIGGSYLVHIYLCEMAGEPTGSGSWHLVNQLPPNTVVTHREMIERGLEYFL